MSTQRDVLYINMTNTTRAMKILYRDLPSAELRRLIAAMETEFAAACRAGRLPFEVEALEAKLDVARAAAARRGI